MDLKVIIIFSTILTIIDLIWIGVINVNLWKDHVLAIQKSPLEIRPVYGVLSYLFIIFAGLYFVQSNTNKTNYKYNSLVNGFLLGLSLYAVYDFTALAILKDYRLDIAIMDMIWGGVLMASSLYATNYYIYG
jgi:uncharacterized membrane protein